MDKYQFYFSDDRTEHLEILKGLGDYNLKTVGYRDKKKLNILLKKDDKLIGGILGFSYWNWAYIDTLWLAEDNRKQGLGKNLMERFETTAMKRGCFNFHVETYAFQALEFYQALEYEVFGKLEGIADGRTKFYLKKQLEQREL